MDNNQKEKPRVAGRAFVVSFKNHRKNTIPSQWLNQHACALKRFYEMQEAAALFQAYPSYANAMNAQRVGNAFYAAFTLTCREM